MARTAARATRTVVSTSAKPRKAASAASAASRAGWSARRMPVGSSRQPIQMETRLDPAGSQKRWPPQVLQKPRRALFDDGYQVSRSGAWIVSEARGTSTDTK